MNGQLFGLSEHEILKEENVGQQTNVFRQLGSSTLQIYYVQFFKDYGKAKKNHIMISSTLF